MKPTKLIVFDSNAYIDLAGNKWLYLELLPLLRKIKKAENEKGYQPLINLTVARELMSHLLDRGNGNSYTKSCTAMYKHCGTPTQYGMLHLPEVELAHVFFNQVPKASIQSEQAMGQMLYMISDAFFKKRMCRNLCQQITQIRTEVASAEEGLATEVENLFRNYDPNFSLGELPFGKNSALRKKFLSFIQSQQFMEQTALANVLAIHLYLNSRGIKIPMLAPLQTQNLTSLYIKSFPASLQFRKNYFTKFSSSCFNLRREGHSNYLWDELILRDVDQAIQDVPLYLVTTDGDMAAAAKQINPNAHIMTFEEYMKDLNIQPDLLCIHQCFNCLKSKIRKARKTKKH